MLRLLAIANIANVQGFQLDSFQREDGESGPDSPSGPECSMIVGDQEASSTWRSGVNRAIDARVFGCAYSGTSPRNSCRDETRMSMKPENNHCKQWVDCMNDNCHKHDHENPSYEVHVGDTVDSSALSEPSEEHPEGRYGGRQRPFFNFPSKSQTPAKRKCTVVLRGPAFQTDLQYTIDARTFACNAGECKEGYVAMAEENGLNDDDMDDACDAWIGCLNRECQYGRNAATAYGGFNRAKFERLTR